MQINIEKKHLYFLTIISVFLIGVLFVIAYDIDITGGDPPTMGHTANELDVNTPGGTQTLQDLYDAGTVGIPSDGLPVGTIMAFHGLATPDSTLWFLADGRAIGQPEDCNNDASSYRITQPDWGICFTPDLRGRFIVGEDATRSAGGVGSLGDTGGSISKTTGGSSNANVPQVSGGAAVAKKSHTHSIGDIQPPYYVVKYYIKVNPSV